MIKGPPPLEMFFGTFPNLDFLTIQEMYSGCCMAFNDSAEKVNLALADQSLGPSENWT